MEERLLKYRLEKADNLRQGFRRRFAMLFEADRMPLTNNQEVSSTPHHEEIESLEPEAKPFSYSKAIIWLCLWILGFQLFIHIEFGAVYFCVTALIFIYLNTRTGKKLRNEISAYSVFNKNCETIDGTFTAEQFEKQVRSGML